MANGLVEVMPGIYHGLCTWHLMQNGIKHLGNLMKGESHFLSDFKKCMYGYDDEEQFEDGWKALLVKYEVEEKTWLQRVYNLKEHWASCFMKKAFTLGMRSTQLSESVNAYIKSFMNVDLEIIKFFKCFEDVVEEKRYKELKCEYEAHQKIPRLKNPYSYILQQMSKIYTPTLFGLLQEEYELFEACSIKNINLEKPLVHFVIVMVEDLVERKVSFDLDKKSICCTCRKFENFGILCCHSVKVFIHMGVKSVPEQYILKRWTKLARSGTLPILGVNGVVHDVDFTPTQRYKEICPLLIRIATEACRSLESFTFLSKVIDELDRLILDFQNCQVSIPQVNEFISNFKEIASSNNGSTQPKGFKKPEGKKGSKRFIGWAERNLNKTTKKGGSSASQHKGKKGSES